MTSPSVELINGTSVVHLDGPAVIDTATSLHALFTQAVENQLPVALDLSHLTDCDSTFIQLIVSLCRTLIRQGNRLSLANSSVPEQVKHTIAALGFHCKEGCVQTPDATCILSMIAGTIGAKGAR